MPRCGLVLLDAQHRSRCCLVQAKCRKDSGGHGSESHLGRSGRVILAILVVFIFTPNLVGELVAVTSERLPDLFVLIAVES